MTRGYLSTANLSEVNGKIEVKISLCENLVFFFSGPPSLTHAACARGAQ